MNLDIRISSLDTMYFCHITISAINNGFIALQRTGERVLFHYRIAQINCIMTSNNPIEIAGYGLGYL